MLDRGEVALGREELPALGASPGLNARPSPRWRRGSSPCRPAPGGASGSGCRRRCGAAVGGRRWRSGRRRGRRRRRCRHRRCRGRRSGGTGRARPSSGPTGTNRPRPPWPEFQKSWAGCAYVSLAWTRPMSLSRWPLAEEQVLAAVEVVVEEEQAELQRRLGRGAQAVDVRQVGELEAGRVVDDVQGRHLVGEVGDGQAERAVALEVGPVDAHRPAAWPAWSKAMPEIMPISSNVPSPWLWNRKFGTVSLATARSTRPSPSMSYGATPSDLAIGAFRSGVRIAMPAASASRR